MTTEKNRDWTAVDLPVVQYLNQRITFDLLATIEDGFSHFTTMETYSHGASSTEAAGQAGVRIPFLELGAKVTGTLSDETTEHERTTQQKIYTPASLFARLRNELRSRNLVHNVSDPASITETREGCFVEFEATLHRHQFVEMLSIFEILLPMADSFGDGSGDAKRNQGKQRRNNNQNTSDQATLKQIKSMQAAISGAGSSDVIAKVGTVSMLLTVEDSWFIDPTMNDVLDGTFRVFGKATRVVSDASEEINLLRRSPLGKLTGVREQMIAAMAEASDSVFEGGVPETRIFGPTLQVIPIAIFA